MPLTSRIKVQRKPLPLSKQSPRSHRHSISLSGSQRVLGPTRIRRNQASQQGAQQTGALQNYANRELAYTWISYLLTKGEKFWILVVTPANSRPVQHSEGPWGRPSLPSLCHSCSLCFLPTAADRIAGACESWPFIFTPADALTTARTTVLHLQAYPDPSTQYSPTVKPRRRGSCSHSLKILRKQNYIELLRF